jgi:hypothetical protein
MDGQCQENLPTVLGGMALPGLETRIWRLEEIVLDAFVIHLGGIGMEGPPLSFGVDHLSSGHR